MPGLGTIMNCAAIVVGSLIGVVLKRGLPEKWQQTMMSGIALCIVVIGLQMAMKTNNIIITIGADHIDQLRMQRLGDWVGGKVAKGDASVAARIAEGFVNASILFCTGAMAIVGSIQDGILADHTTLFAKGTLDGIISLILPLKNHRNGCRFLPSFSLRHIFLLKIYLYVTILFLCQKWENTF